MAGVKTGSRGQVLCDGCHQCRLGYHCSACAARWRERAMSRSQMRAHRRREAQACCRDSFITAQHRTATINAADTSNLGLPSHLPLPSLPRCCTRGGA